MTHVTGATHHYGQNQNEIDALNSFVPRAQERVIERANERMSAAERAIKASRAKQANEIGSESE